MASATEAEQALRLSRLRRRHGRETAGGWRTVPLEAPAGVDAIRLATLAASVGLGLTMVGVGDTIARGSSKFAEPLWWAGMFLLWVPSTVRIVGRNATRSERIAILLMLGMAMYMVSILYSPRYLTGFDDLLHLRTATDIVRTGRLFHANPDLPVSPVYPGLEIATSAIAKLTGLSATVSGRIVVGAARLIMILALYLLYERVSRSSWLASLATAAYFTNPQFLFFDSAYAYESLGIALAVLVLYAVARGRDARTRDALGSTLLATLPLAAAVATHHVTSFILVLALVILGMFAFAFEPGNVRWWLWGIALVGAGLVLLWLYLVAGRVISYLEPTIAGGLRQLIQLVRLGGTSRKLFESHVGHATPLVEQLGSVSFAAITVLALPIAGLRVWRARRFETFTVAFLVCAVAYPVTNLFRFTAIGAFLAERVTAFVFVPVSFCIAVAVSAKVGRELRTRATVAVVIIGAVLLYGGITLAAPPWRRLPGPYLAVADDRSVELEGISAASWAGKYLPPNSRIGGDRINDVLMMTYGGEQPVTAIGDRVDLAPVFFSPRLNFYDLGLLHRGMVRYLVVDYRLTRSLPWEGFYYDPGEPGASRHERPIPGVAFAKFDRAIGASRVFDSGDVVIFGVRGLARHG